MSTNTQSVCHELRRLWQPTKERLKAIDPSHPTAVRIHRSLSWLERAEQDPVEADLVLICRWIALNSLYGTWDVADGRAVGHQDSLRAFLERLLKIDQSGRLRGVLVEHKRLVLALLEDKFLNDYFWEEPEQSGGRLSRDRYRAQTWYVEQRWLVILEAVLERIYLLRCQLMHGAATFGGKLNRTAIGRSATMLGHLVPAALEVVIGCGADQDWGTMCYPPMHGSPGSVGVRPIRPR